MSFGWSAGDIISAITLLVDIGGALRESGGAASDYQETTLYLEGLVATLEELRTYLEDHASQERIGALQTEVSVVKQAVQTFKDKIDRKFGSKLGGHGGRGWRSIFSCPRKVQYALFVSEAAISLQDKIATPLRSFQINLGIETRGALSDVQSVVSRIESLLATKSDEESRMKDRKLLQKVGEWLSPVPSTESDFEAFKRGLRPGTCEWIFNDLNFSRWMEFNTDSSGPPLFWVSGIPGAGKSYLATRIIKELRELCPVAYFYCDAKDEQKRSVLNILRTWAWQLLQQIPNCLARIAEIKSRGAKPSVANMLEALRLLAINETGCRFVLDGLDECDPVARRELFSILPDILSHSRVLIVSRHESDISLGISKSGKSKGYASFRISEADNGNDITDYLQAEVDDMKLDDKALEEKVLTSLQQSARGMFLWARLMIEDLSVPGRSIEEYEAALQDLPQGLDELYGRVLDNLHSNSTRRERSRQLFQWLSCALRPLTIGELKEALAIGLDDEHFQPKKKIPNFAATLRQCCGPLIDIDASDETIPVTLIHASVKDFLLSTPGGNPTYSSLFVESTIAHAYIARACLTYLGFNEIELVNVNEDWEGSLQKLDAHIGAWYFLNYASLHWYMHLKGCLTSREAIQSFKRFYSSEDSTVKWLQLVSRLHGDRGVHLSSPASRLIDLLKTFQLAELLENDPVYQKWLEHLDGPPTGRFSRWQRFMNSRGTKCSPVLHICAFFDFEAFTEKLIRERDFVDDLRDHHGSTALHQAGRADSEHVIQILLAAGASVDARDNWDWTPLMYAITWEALSPEYCRSGTFEVAIILINLGADVCVKSTKFDTALTLACDIPLPEDNHVLSLVTRMLDHGATEIINWGKDAVPISLAAINNSIRLFRTLLSNGAYVEAGPYGNERNEVMRATPLVYFCDRKDCLAIPILIEAGANVHVRDFDGRTSLHKTARVDSYHASKLLLEHGADVNAVASDGSMPIHEAARENHIAQIEILVKNNTQLEVKDSSGRTPLDIAIDNNSAEAVSLLTGAGANASRNGRVTEIIDGLLKVTIRPQKHQPETVHDLFHVFWILTRGLKKRLPQKIVTKITTLAQYWLKSEDSRSDYLLVTMKDVGPAYLKSRPIQGRVRKIVLTTESHDQGISNFPAEHGTYFNTWTWFAVVVFDAEGLPVVVDDHESKIQSNVHASGLKRKHIVVYGDGHHARQARWLDKLRKGDIVGVVPHARFPGWENHVYAVQVEIYTTCLLE